MLQVELFISFPGFYNPKDQFLSLRNHY
uniref:Uncharacterized protein n=1 Tax=Nelumbo nucifera TaxID=4432 RepID=A0A822ZU12_NELNU|nr:TPA_asm: hypothetical protein HUJ06_016716 [Nelumbo nucifera]